MAELLAWRWQVWSASVRGASHLRSQTPNQDAVAHWLSESNPRGPVILAVADGHGSDRSFRSDIGSQLAVRLAVESCRDFANDLRGATPSQVKQSAEQRLPIHQPPRRMSFKRTWTTFKMFLWSPSATPTDAPRWRVKYRDTLQMATQDKLPNRPGRSFERETYPRRPKSNHFKKRRPIHSAFEPDS